MKRVLAVGALVVGALGLAVAPAFAAAPVWAYASGQMSVTATATCPAGTAVTGGGYQMSENAVVTSSSPSWDGMSWVVSAVNGTPGSGDVWVNAAAMCA